MTDRTPLEEAIYLKLTEHHQGLLPNLSKMERNSLSKYVTAKNVDLIQAWIGEASSTTQSGGLSNPRSPQRGFFLRKPRATTGNCGNWPWKSNAVQI